MYLSLVSTLECKCFFLVSVSILVSISTVFAQLDNLSQNHSIAHSNSFYSAHSSKSRSRSHALFLQAMHISRLHSIKHNISSFSISQILRCRMLFDLKTNKLRIVQGSWIWKKRLLYRKEECSVTKVGGLVVTPIFRWIHQRLQICNATKVRKFVLFFPIDVYDDALARKLRKLICVGLLDDLQRARTHFHQSVTCRFRTVFELFIRWLAGRGGSSVLLKF